MPSLPSVGQIVDIRRRRFVVQEVRPALQSQDALLPDALTRRLISFDKYHLVSLSSVEDDSIGQERQIVWEIEPGASVHDDVALPQPGVYSDENSAFDAPARFDAFLHAVRWGSISSADISALEAPFRSGIDIQDYQLDPVVRALAMPRVSLLIADDVGLGKTIEAGLVVQELFLRYRARNCLIVCPADIQIQWQSEMREKFGLEFRIVDSNMMRQLRRERGLHVNPWAHFPRLITSIDFLKRDRPLRLFRETLPAPGESVYPRRRDLLIVDEAHNIAPSGGGRVALDSQRTAAIRELVPHFEHKLFLSATPHNGYPESFSSLLELLDNQRFTRGVKPDPVQLANIMIRRLKSDPALALKWDGSTRFARRQLEAIEVDHTSEEKQAHELLREYSGLRRSGSADGSERIATEFVLKLLKKRLFSSPQAFLDTLQKHRQSLAGNTTREKRQRQPANILKMQIEGVDDSYSSDEEWAQLQDDATTEASSFFRPPSDQENHILNTLESWADRSSGSGDSKLAALLQWMKNNLTGNDNRVIIFTEYRSTQKWLFDKLSAAGWTRNGQLEIIFGGMDSDERERIKNAFQASPADSPLRILLATDAASEGVNLQNHCSRLIHYEIPWNPNRMEQRNGRVDRHGQRAPEVQIYHFVGAGFQNADSEKSGDLDGDWEFLYRAAQKVENIREDLGTVGPVLAQQVEEAMLGKRREIDTSQAEQKAAPVKKLLAVNRDLKARLQKLYDQLRTSQKELQISESTVHEAVAVALELNHQPPLEPVDVPGLDGTAYKVPPLSGSWSECLIGLEHPYTRQLRPIVFEARLAEGRDDVVLAHLNHRLVRMCLRLLRAEMWGATTSSLHRFTIRLARDEILDAPALIAHGRIVVLGGDNSRLHEEIISAGGFLREGRFVPMNVGQTQAALSAQLDDAAPQSFGETLIEKWPHWQKPLITALGARERERTRNLQKFLDERQAKEQSDIKAILDELEKGIRAELSATPPQQLQLWSDEERDQLRRNTSSLQARLEALPTELEREMNAIAARYADPHSHLFPAAVSFLVPRKLAVQGL